jgi:hypothetical protein
MDETIIIGDMEEMNIFDDIKMNQDDENKKNDDETITFKHEEF